MLNPPSAAAKVTRQVNARITVRNNANTLFVMSGIYFPYKDAYAEALGKTSDELMGVIMGIVTFNGIIEAVVAAVIATAVCTALVYAVPTYDVAKKKAAAA